MPSRLYRERNRLTFGRVMWRVIEFATNGLVAGVFLLLLRGCTWPG
jgi:hypothetical protein